MARAALDHLASAFNRHSTGEHILRPKPSMAYAGAIRVPDCACARSCIEKNRRMFHE